MIKELTEIWTIMAGVPETIGGLSHIPSILRKDDAEKTEELVLTDVVSQEIAKLALLPRIQNQGEST